ncbi:MAG: sulfurtransferase TusA family protein [Polyangiaceae bacterium]|nr:sulfurtransferase TusA family protein [Polyangiaceae bacterium]
MAVVELDCKGLNCPMPIVKISRAIKALQIGDRLHVLASDPSFKADVEAWAKRLGHTLVEFTETSGIQSATLEKKVG